MVKYTHLKGTCMEISGAEKTFGFLLDIHTPTFHTNTHTCIEGKRGKWIM